MSHQAAGWRRWDRTILILLYKANGLSTMPALKAGSVKKTLSLWLELSVVFLIRKGWSLDNVTLKI